MNIPLAITTPLVVCGITVAKRQYQHWKFMKDYNESLRKSKTTREFMVCDKMYRDYKQTRPINPIWKRILTFQKM